jgi:hypothetical protein
MQFHPSLMMVDKVTYYEGPTYKGVHNGIVDIADTREREKKKKRIESLGDKLFQSSMEGRSDGWPHGNSLDMCEITTCRRASKLVFFVLSPPRH